MDAVSDADFYELKQYLNCEDNGPNFNYKSNINFEEYFQQDSSPQEVFTPSTDSGNHSPTSSSSDGSHQQSWAPDDQKYPELDAYMNNDMTPPEPVNLEDIEALLSEESEKNYVSEYEGQPKMQYSVPASQLAYSYNLKQQQQQSNNSNYVNHYPQQQHIQSTSTSLPSVKLIAVPQQTQRVQPYTLIRPNKIIKTEPVQYLQPSTTSTPIASAPQTFIIATSDINLFPSVVQPRSNSVFVSAPTRNISSTSRNHQNDDTVRRKNEEFSRKCEDRKLRNRHSAQLSRERKKAEYEQMKSAISELCHENDELKRENLKLKSRICELESHFGIPSTTSGKTKVVKAVGASFMVMMLFMSFPGAIRNLTPTTIESSPHRFARGIAQVPNDTAVIKVGSRSLLAVDDYDANLEYDSIPSSRNSSYRSCVNGFLNTTQRIKVNNDLINWIDRHDKMNLVQLRNGKNPLLIYNSRKSLFPSGKQNDSALLRANSTEIMNISEPLQKRGERRRYKDSARQRTLVERAWQHIDVMKVYGPRPRNDTDSRVGGTELAIPTNIQEQIMKQLAAQLDQKDDMMYVMALKDYFILPRIAPSNSTEAPKMSIIVPALAVPHGAHPNQIKMMRIECTVTSTSLFFLPDGLVSLFNGSAN